MTRALGTAPRWPHRPTSGARRLRGPAVRFLLRRRAPGSALVGGRMRAHARALRSARAPVSRPPTTKDVFVYIRPLYQHARWRAPEAASGFARRAQLVRSRAGRARRAHTCCSVRAQRASPGRIPTCALCRVERARTSARETRANGKRCAHEQVHTHSAHRLCKRPRSHARGAARLSPAACTTGRHLCPPGRQFEPARARSARRGLTSASAGLAQAPGKTSSALQGTARTRRPTCLLVYLSTWRRSRARVTRAHLAAYTPPLTVRSRQAA